MNSGQSPAPLLAVGGMGSRSFILVCGSIIAIGPLSIDMYLPAMTSLQQDLRASSAQVQATMATYLIGLAIGQLLYGPVSDAFGRRPALTVGLSLYFVAALGCALASTIDFLILMRFIQALGGCSGAVVVRAMVRDRFAPQDVARTLTSLTLVMGVSPLIAPLLGGFVFVHFGWRAIFVILAAYSLAALAALHWGIGETHRRRSGVLSVGRLRRSFGRLLRHRRFMGCALAAGFAQAGLYVYLSSAALVFSTVYRLDAASVGPLFAVSSGCYIVGSQLNRVLLHRAPAEALMRRGLRVYLVVTTVLSVVLWGEFGGLVGALVLIGASLGVMGVVFPNAIAIALAPFPSRAGTAASVIGVLQYGVSGLISALVGLAGHSTGFPMGAAMAICALFAVVFVRLLVPARAAKPGR